MNIFHCCIQKTASQWFSKFFNDKLILKTGNYNFHYPGENFFDRKPEVMIKLNEIPQNAIISPLYIYYTDFCDRFEESDYKAFFVMRDPRDMIVSQYFSLRYSHVLNNQTLVEMRQKLSSMSLDEGIFFLITKFAKFFQKVLLDWRLAYENKNVKICRYEDLLGNEQKSNMISLINFLEIDLSHDIIKQLLEKYKFENFAGRLKGTEDQHDHYRKGISGDWMNYFNEGQKNLFKKEMGQLLIDLGYENDLNW